jgi:methylase of polypeptide subunit release factors
MIREAPGVHPVDDISREALERLPVRSGDRVLDLGCGTGVYGLAARLLGAEAVLLTDLDPRAVACARVNARRNSLSRVELRVGDLFSPCRGARFDLIIANLPQTPGPEPFLPSKWGGPDGTLHLRRLLKEAPRHLRRRGRVFFLLHDLSDSRRIVRLASRRFKLRSVYRVRREFDPGEYDDYHCGLFAYLEKLRTRGVSRFHGSGRSRWFHLRFMVARLRDEAPQGSRPANR